jgi:5-methylcytosine-specific restriction endonuclease McrA
MSRYISEDIRRIVAARADFRCEYCKMPEEHAFFTFYLDHIMSIKHGGQTTLENLAYACAYCN